MVFVHDINPIFLQIGPIAIRYYGLIYSLGLLLCYIALRYASKKGFIENLNFKNVDDVFLYLILGCVVGARLGVVLFYDPIFYLTNPIEIFKVWNGGLSFHGAVLGLSGIIYFLTKKYDIKFYELADFLVIPASFALFFGRIANFINAELVGTVTESNFCVEYNQYEGCRHPSQIYEAFKNIFNGLILLAMYRSRKFRSGFVFYSFIFLYGLLRFLITFLRDDPERFFLMPRISIGQVYSLLMVFIALFWFIKNKSSLLVNK